MRKLLPLAIAILLLPSLCFAATEATFEQKSECLLVDLASTRFVRHTANATWQSGSGTDAAHYYDNQILCIIGLVGDKAPSFVLSKTVGIIVQVVLNILFVVEGMNILGLSILSNIGNNIIGYLPNVLASVLIAIAASLLGIAAEKALKKGGLGSSIIFVRSAIWAVAAFMILNQLGIATKIVTAAFIIILAAIAIAFAVSFGIGGREFAKKQLEKLDKKIDNKE